MDYQRILCEDPKQYNAWFERVRTIIEEYGITEADIYNFDETGFMMGIITTSMVVTSFNRIGRPKQA